MKFLELETRPLDLGSHPCAAEMADVEAEKQFVDLVHRAFEVNTKILADAGLTHPTHLGGLFSYPEDEMPADLLEARRIIDAAGRVWRSLHAKPVRAAAAGMWLGIMLGPESFRNYQKQTASQPRSEPKQQARALFESRPHWKSTNEFRHQVRKKGIAVKSVRQVADWFYEFKKE